MELSDSDRPVSFGSTSSSASSRDSHGSFGSRTTLTSSSHLGLFNQDKEAGAVKLELLPARPFPSSEQQRPGPAGPWDAEGDGQRPLRAPRRMTPTAASKAATTTDDGPKLLYVDRVVQEILETERTYVQDLKSIVEDYLDCIRNRMQLPLGTEERAALFGNIQDIYRFNSELLHDLENCENDPVAIAECFVSKSEEFHIYTQYCTNYPRSVAVLTECMRSKMLAKFFRERQETLKHSLPLGSYLLKPVQRILKYHLLLHEIENHLDKDAEGYDVVLDAIDTMQRVAWHINDMKRKHEHAVRLQEIQSLLPNWKGPDLTSYGELVLEGTFRLQRAKNERTLFLLDKLLLITKKRDDTFTYKAHILCCNLMLVEVIPKEPLSFSVFHYKNPKLQHTVQAKSQQDKRLWVLHLKRLILENHVAKIPAKAKQAILEMDAIHHPGFCYSPEGEAQAFCSSREGSAPHRLRRKSEPSSRSHKVLKTSETAQDTQKVSGAEGAPRLPSAGQAPRHRSSQPGSSALAGDLWGDPQVRRALFPGGRCPEDEDDDYQLFVPSFSSSDLNSRLSDDGASSRPCSWHLGQAQPPDPRGAGHRAVRRASSAGEGNTGPGDGRLSREAEGPGGGVSLGSCAELTLDDIDHVYDNISFEDLKLLVAQRDEADAAPPRTARDAARPKSTPELAFPKRRGAQAASRPPATGDGATPCTGAADEGPQGPEENVYDTIRLPEPPPLALQRGSLAGAKRGSFLGLEADFACCDSLRPFVSQDSLQLSEDETPGPPARDPLSGSSCSLSGPDKSLSDRLSEEVDEIWNDLENYIKKNEDKTRERLLASFPVSRDDVRGGPPAGGTPEISRDARRPLPAPAFPAPAASRSSRTRCPPEDELIAKEDPFLSLCQLPRASETPPVENPYDLVPGSPAQADPENPGLEATDKTKSRVFLMARQYSQKIKKANQLLKVKSPESEPLAGEQPRAGHKDLVAILEEKRQGGPAIGARIAAYSQLYDQVVFRESPLKTQKDAQASPPEPSTPRPASPPESQPGSKDWLLHATYSNGELADFCPRPEEDWRWRQPTVETDASSTPSQLSPACSVPSLRSWDPWPGPLQRHSVVVTQPNKEPSCHGHLYHSLGRKRLTPPSQPYGRSQSSSSILVNKAADTIGHPGDGGKQQPPPSPTSARGQGHQDPPSGIADARGTGKCSDLTLQDTQKVLVVNRNLPLSAHIATQNYFSNFKETDGDEDDYVEIKSEEDESELEPPHGWRRRSHPKILGADLAHQDCSNNTPDSLGSPCVPKRPINNQLGLSPYLTSYNDPDKLSDYLWRGPSPNQQNIVQSLREKFQCLSSSSFA
ncbi:pleckstrin homology domain-containing family G member 1 [Dasypus novemcinctus]|uniref:pleckstrin homology domain-containing family G member 1 n=1 Tax=Dasypus novemcinctus TaxID=9361 RepID=UPI00265DCDA3|nr:pleckstrin homology domain-containing family G member 1 [Dasypus novemcinctus]XP_058145667.1 pleckstrin homology domain-containing family G member 1 [Dasypus novemcinctus]